MNKKSKGIWKRVSRTRERDQQGPSLHRTMVRYLGKEWHQAKLNLRESPGIILNPIILTLSMTPSFLNLSNLSDSPPHTCPSLCFGLSPDSLISHLCISLCLSLLPSPLLSSPSLLVDSFSFLLDFPLGLKTRKNLSELLFFLLPELKENLKRRNQAIFE